MAEPKDLTDLCLWKLQAQKKASRGYTLDKVELDCLRCRPTPFQHCEDYTTLTTSQSQAYVYFKLR